MSDEKEPDAYLEGDACRVRVGAVNVTREAKGERAKNGTRRMRKAQKKMATWIRKV